MKTISKLTVFSLFLAVLSAFLTSRHTNTPLNPKRSIGRILWRFRTISAAFMWKNGWGDNLTGARWSYFIAWGVSPSPPSWLARLHRAYIPPRNFFINSLAFISVIVYNIDTGNKQRKTAKQAANEGRIKC